jgi:hypothetical protein
VVIGSLAQRSPSGSPARRDGRIVAVAIATLAIAASAVLVGRANAASPYGPSSILSSSITWDQSSFARYGNHAGDQGSDIWDTAWASDNQVYAAWGDGIGFSLPAEHYIGMSHLGIGTNPLALTGTGDTYWGTTKPWANGCPGVEQTTLGGKPRGLVALPSGRLYMFHSLQDIDCTPPVPDQYLATSTNNGSTWTDGVTSFKTWPDAAGFAPSAFLQTGQAQNGALVSDSGTTPYLYMYGHKTGGATGTTYLARVPATDTAISDPSQWRYYGGLSTDPATKDEPNWLMPTQESSMVPVFTDPDHADGLSVSYDRGIGRYIAISDHGNGCLDGGDPAACLNHLGMFDAPTPWGPWTTIDYRSDFGDATGCGTHCTGTSPAVSYNLPTKYISSDGLTIYPAFSGTGSNTWDSLNFLKGTVGLASGSTVKGLSVSKNGTTITPAVLSKLSTTYPGNKEYIDRQYEITALPSGYSGLEQIRLANNDKSTPTTTNYVTFSLTTPKTVCVAWDHANAVQPWVTSGYTNTGKTITGNATFDVYKSNTTLSGTVTVPGPNSHDMYLLLVGCS